MLNKCVLSSFLNTAGLAAARMSGGSEFHVAGPACEKARSPNVLRNNSVFGKNLKCVVCLIINQSEMCRS